MSNELEINSRVELMKTLVNFAHPERGHPSVIGRDVSGSNISHTVQTVSPTLPGEQIQAAGVTSGGYLYLENLGQSHVKIIEKDTLKSFAKILPKQYSMFRTGDDFLTSYRIVANQLECDVLIIWFDE